MTTLSAFRRAAIKEPLPPAVVIMVEPRDYADECPKRPQSAIAVGFRRLSETSMEGVRVEAAKRVARQWPDGGSEDQLIESFNDAAMCIALGRAICDPNDVLRGHDAFEMPEDQLADELSSQGLRRIWQLYERACIETSQLQRELTDEQILTLADDLLDELPALSRLGPARERRVRRLLGFVADELDELAVAPEES